MELFALRRVVKAPSIKTRDTIRALWVNPVMGTDIPQCEEADDDAAVVAIAA
jgi:hypothetical protein